MPRKEWEMAFAVTANMGSGFQSTFSKAQQQIAEMQKGIQALNREQADIQAYQKQQQAVESTARKLEVLQQQYDNIQKEMEETGNHSSDMENKLLSKQLQIEKTSQSLERQTGELNRLGDSLQEAGVDTARLTEESSRLEAEMTDLKQRQVEAAEESEEYGKRGAAAFEAVGSALAAAGILRGLKEIYQAYAQCVSVAADFEASMSNVEALSGANAGELEQLSAMAKELGATTKFTAKESADAMGYMAMAGWSAEQMLSGMPGVLSLAAASGEDLATVSDIVTDSMTAFGLKASDTQRYADILAQTASKANTNVSMMGETFKYAAPLAGALGYDVEDVAVATGLMANAGIKAGEAGTTLRGLFTRLAKPTKESADAMNALGLSLTDGAGKMLPFMDLMEQMRDSFSGLTEEEQAFYAAELAGQRAMSGLLAIVNASEEDFAALSTAITDSTGAAQRMADIKMDNMTGQLTLLNSAWEAVQTTVGEQFTPDLAELYGWGAKMLGEINSFIQANPALVKGITATVAVLGTATAGLLAFAAAKKLAAALSLGTLLPAAGPILAAVAAVAALTGAIVALTSAERKRLDSELSAKSKEERAELEKLEAEYRSVCDSMGETSAEAQLLKRELDQATAAFEANKMTVKEAAEAHQALMDGYREMEQVYAEQNAGIDRQAESSANLMTHLLDLVNAENQTAGQKERILALVDMLNESMPELGLAYDANTNSINMTADALRDYIRAEVDAARQQSKLEEVKERIGREAALNDDVARARAAAAEKQAAYNAALAEYNAMQEKFGDIVDETSYQIMGPYADALTSAREEMQEANTVYKNAVRVYNDNEEAIETLSNELAGYTEAQRAAADESALLTLTVEDVVGIMQELGEAYKEAYDAAYSSIHGQYALWDEAAEVAETKTSDITASIEQQTRYWNDYNANLAALAERTDDIAGLRAVIASFADGSEDSVNAIAGMAEASDEDLAAMVANWEALQKAHDDTSKSIAEFKTDFTNQMDELTASFQQDIENMNFSDEAGRAARETIQGFIDGAEAMTIDVQNAYERIAQTAIDAINRKLDIHSPSKVMEEVAGYTWQGFINETEAMQPEVEKAMAEAVSAGVGALSADNMQVMALAPQLMEALTARSVGAEAVGSAPAPVSVSVSFNIEGNAGEATVEALTEYGEEFAERVRAVLEDAGIEASRREYR